MHDIRKRARSNGIPTELTQYNLKPGLRKFGTRGEKAALKEMTQLHIMDTWTPMDAGKLSQEQRMRALSSLLFL